jgi:D-aminopeptidase
MAIGALSPGPGNAITDVAGVRVGHTTLISGEGPLVRGRGPVRTGVTVVLPHGENLFREKVSAAVYTINGHGKTFGFEQVRELGVIEGPLALTNTLNVGLVADALVEHAIHANPGIGVSTTSVNVVVGETNDGYLSDLQGRHVRAEHVWSAIDSASVGEVAEGSVGAGTGTSCFGWKGGIGTASRVIAGRGDTFTLGALVQTNFGRPDQLTIAGVPVGRQLRPPSPDVQEGGDDGSVMIVLATDAPLNSRQLQRLCVRTTAGLARTGSVLDHASGDFAIAFSTTYRVEHEPEALVVSLPLVVDEARLMQELFPAVAECVEEAVLNALWRATTVVGRDGHALHALPLEAVASLLGDRASWGEAGR